VVRNPDLLTDFLEGSKSRPDQLLGVPKPEVHGVVVDARTGVRLEKVLKPGIAQIDRPGKLARPHVRLLMQQSERLANASVHGLQLIN